MSLASSKAVNTAAQDIRHAAQAIRASHTDLSITDLTEHIIPALKDLQRAVTERTPDALQPKQFTIEETR